MLSRIPLASLACLALLVSACTAPRDFRDDDPSPTKKDGGSSDGGTADGGTVDGGATDGGVSCSGAMDDCNHDPQDGCETNTMTTAAHCGGCDNPCAGACVDGTCHVGAASIELCAFDGPTLLGCATPPTSLAIDFGKPPSGNLAKRTLQVRSSGASALQVEGPAFSGNADFAGTPDPFSVQLVPNEKATMNLTFGPLAIGPRSATLILSTNVPGAEVINVALSGGDAGGTCQLQATQQIDFGNVSVLTSSTQPLTLSNTGTVDCVIPSTPAFLNGFGGLFELVPSTWPLTVSPGTSQSFSIRYTPQDSSGPDTATLQVKYAAPGGVQKQLNVTLSGSPVLSSECIIEATPAVNGSGVRLLDFGTTGVNSTSTLAVTFKNKGGIACTVSNPRFSTLFGSSSAFSLLSTASQTIPPNGTATYNVSFKPTALGEYGTMASDPVYGVQLDVDTTDTVRFATTNCGSILSPGAAGCVGWVLHGTAVNPTLTAVPDSFAFGTVKTSCRSPSSDLALLAGGADVTVTKLRIDPTSPAVFSYTAPSTPFTIAAGTTKTIPIRFQPSSASSYAATLYIESSLGTVTVPLTGTGTSTTRWSETQLASAKTDMLFVVDDSGSMDQKQSWLKNAIASFISTASSLGADYQIALVTTDMTDAARSGNFVGTPKVITPASNPTTTLQSRVLVGSSGSGYELGLGAMKAALSPPLVNDPQKNGGFLRSDANLAVVVVSDEEDQSTGTSESYVQFLKTLKGKRSAVLHAIVGDPSPSTNSSGGSGCKVSVSGSYVDADSGTRYLAVQSATGGVFRSICATDWTSYLTDIASNAFAVPRSFLLSRPATSGTLAVKVNGGAVSASTYSFDATSNTVTFNVASAPAAGSAVTIDYDPVCLP